MSVQSIIDTSFERKVAGVCNESWTHKCSPTIVALFRHGQQGHSK